MKVKRYLMVGIAASAVAITLAGCTPTEIHPPGPVATSAAPVSSSPTEPPSSIATPASSPTQSAVASETPTPDPEPTRIPVGNKAAKALAQLSKLTVKEADYSVPYSRTKDFGPAWEDVDHNGCDTRNDILRRDLTAINYKASDPGCTVASGILHDPYTNRQISFVRGQGTSMAVEIDHVDPLHEIWMHGAANWTQTEREQYANDPFVLLAVDGPANEQKGDSGPADWLPSNVAYHCTYIEKFVAIKAKYNLTISRRDAAASRKILSACS